MDNIVSQTDEGLVEKDGYYLKSANVVVTVGWTIY